jgi:hypothetical protein
MRSVKQKAILELFIRKEGWIDRLSTLFSQKAMLYELTPYFRSVFNVLNSQSQYDSSQAKRNIEFFGSQLSVAELHFIGLYILFNSDGKKNLKPLVLKYSLFSNLMIREDEWVVEMYPNLIYLLYHLPNYGKRLFEQEVNGD